MSSPTQKAFVLDANPNQYHSSRDGRLRFPSSSRFGTTQPESRNHLPVTTNRVSLPALRVRQWLAKWDDIDWNPAERRTEPPHYFYQFTMPAQRLRRLSDVYPRTTDRATSVEDLGIQRSRDEGRSEEIRRFIQHGYPLSTVSAARLASPDLEPLRQPGWLPTAILVNILTAQDRRNGRRVAARDLITVSDRDALTATLSVPAASPIWEPEGVPPIEVIDGQHRLWAFGDDELAGAFDVPVVAFHGIDLSWQAYLFYIINIKPKKINASLAFDLYPLLRTEEWLNQTESHVVYRETRAQEIVDLLWFHESSPWHKRINMLGAGSQRGLTVTQASWVRSLLASFVKRWDGPGTSIGGIFGSHLGREKAVLGWSRTDQAAFLMVVGRSIRDRIYALDSEWTHQVRKHSGVREHGPENDPAFYGRHNLLNTDQGIRALLQVANDLCFVGADEIHLHDWKGAWDPGCDDATNISEALASLSRHVGISEYTAHMGAAVASFDWRSSSFPELDETDKQLKASFRGSGGYKELRRSLLRHVATAENPLARTASIVIERLGY